MLKSRILLLLISLFSILLITQAQSTPTLEDIMGDRVYAYLRSETNDPFEDRWLEVVLPDGIQRLPLDSTHYVSQFALSPDGRHVVYETYTRDGNTMSSAGLFLYSIETGEEQSLLGFLVDTNAPLVWSPDSQTIAVYDNYDLYLIGIDGETQLLDVGYIILDFGEISPLYANISWRNISSLSTYRFDIALTVGYMDEDNRPQYMNIQLNTMDETEFEAVVYPDFIATPLVYTSDGMYSVHLVYNDSDGSLDALLESPEEFEQELYSIQGITLDDRYNVGFPPFVPFQPVDIPRISPASSQLIFSIDSQIISMSENGTSKVIASHPNIVEVMDWIAPDVLQIVEFNPDAERGYEIPIKFISATDSTEISFGQDFQAWQDLQWQQDDTLITVAQATATDTPMPSSTPMPTNTPMPTATHTMTASAVIPTMINTPIPTTATMTSTPLPPTATATDIPIVIIPTATPFPVWCDASPESRIGVGDIAFVTISQVGQTRENLRVRETAGGRQVGSMQEGTQFRIVDGPVCADDLTWWQIETLDGTLSGWSAEGIAPDDYFMQPES